MAIVSWRSILLHYVHINIFYVAYLSVQKEFLDILYIAAW